MKRNSLVLLLSVIAVLLAAGICWAEKPPQSNAVLVISGKVLDPAGNPVDDATAVPYLNGKPHISSGHNDKLPTTGRNGLFSTEISASPDQIKDGKWALKISRPSYKPTQLIPLKTFEQGPDSKGLLTFAASTTVSMERFQGKAFWIALIIFILVYVLIAFEILHRTLAAFLGAAVLLFDYSYSRAF